MGAAPPYLSWAIIRVVTDCRRRLGRFIRRVVCLGRACRFVGGLLVAGRGGGAGEFVLIFLLFAVCFFGKSLVLTRGRQVDMGIGGRSIRMILGGVAGRAKIGFFCSRGGVDRSSHIGLGMDGRAVRAMLGDLSVRAKLCFGEGGGAVGMNFSAGRGNLGVLGNGMMSRGNRTIVNTDVRMGNAATKIVASVGNGCRLAGIPVGTRVTVSCVNCRAVVLGTGSGGLTLIALQRSARLLSRIMMMKCNAVGGGSLLNTASVIDNSRLTAGSDVSMNNTLRNGVSNVGVLDDSNFPNTRASVDVHNIKAFNGNSTDPLMIVSKVPMSRNFRALGPSSVRDMGILGSTSSTTVCNSHTTGNIVLVAAGGNTRNGTGMSLGTA